MRGAPAAILNWLHRPTNLPTGSARPTGFPPLQSLLAKGHEDIMKLTIGEPTLSQELLDSYFLTISTYDGDADGSGAFRVVGFKREREDHLQLLEHLLTTLQKVKEAYPSGRGGEDFLSTEVPLFEAWFGYDYPDPSDSPTSTDFPTTSSCSPTPSAADFPTSVTSVDKPTSTDQPAAADYFDSVPDSFTPASTCPPADFKLTLATKLTRELDFRWEPFTTEEANEFLTWAPRIWAFRESTAHLYGASPLDSPKGVWPLDATLLDFSGSEASLSSFTVGYFDEEGRERKVDFEL